MRAAGVAVASGTAVTTGSTGARSGTTALGRTVTIGVPRTTWLSTAHAPADTDWLWHGYLAAGGQW